MNHGSNMETTLNSGNRRTMSSRFAGDRFSMRMASTSPMKSGPIDQKLDKSGIIGRRREELDVPNENH